MLVKAETLIGFILLAYGCLLPVIHDRMKCKDYKEMLVNPCPQFIAQD